MAGQTFTATTLPDQPRNMADGINIATAKYVALTTSLSVSDVINMLRIPEGATILDGYISGKVSSTTALATIVKVGMGNAAATDDDFLATATLSSTTKMIRFDGSSGLPYKIADIAAATYPKWSWLTVTCVSASTTASVSIQVCVTYLTGNLSGL
jgi:hypothetical protein